MAGSRPELAFAGLVALTGAVALVVYLGGPGAQEGLPSSPAPASSAAPGASTPRTPEAPSAGASPQPSRAAPLVILRVSTEEAEALLSALRSSGAETPEFAGRLQELVDSLPDEGLEPLRERLLVLRPDVPAERRELEMLARALAKSRRKGPLGVVASLLAATKDAAIHREVVRAMPPSKNGARAVGSAALAQANPKLREFLLGASALLLGSERDAETEAFFQRAAQEDPREAVRAEAVRIVGRPLGPGEPTLLQDVIVRDPSERVRKQALLSFAQSAGDAALATINGVATDRRETLAIRLTAIRALAAVGTERAALLLEQIAAVDEDAQAIALAKTLAQGVRVRLQTSGSAPR